MRLLVTSAMLGDTSTDPASQWFSLIFRKIFLNKKLPSVMFACGSKQWKSKRGPSLPISPLEQSESADASSSEDSSMFITHDQLILLNILQFELRDQSGLGECKFHRACPNALCLEVLYKCHTGTMSDVECCSICFETSVFSDFAYILHQYEARARQKTQVKGCEPVERIFRVYFYPPFRA